jgi:hypothetical protein
MIDHGGFLLALSLIYLVFGMTPTLTGLFAGSISLIVIGGIVALYKRYRNG